MPDDEPLTPEEKELHEALQAEMDARELGVDEWCASQRCLRKALGEAEVSRRRRLARHRRPKPWQEGRC